MNQFKDRPFALLGVNCDGNTQVARDSAQRYRHNWLSWQQEEDMSISRAYRVSMLPTTFVIDQKGTIRYYDLHGPKLVDAVEKLLREAS